MTHSTLWKLSKELPKLLPSFAECFWSFAKLKEFHFKNLRVYMEACWACWACWPVNLVNGSDLPLQVFGLWVWVLEAVVTEAVHNTTSLFAFRNVVMDSNPQSATACNSNIPPEHLGTLHTTRLVEIRLLGIVLRHSTDLVSTCFAWSTYWEQSSIWTAPANKWYSIWEQGISGAICKSHNCAKPFAVQHLGD